MSGSLSVSKYASACGGHWNHGGLSKLWSLLGPYYNTGPTTGPNLGDPKGTIILTIPHASVEVGQSCRTKVGTPHITFPKRGLG